ncbi:MAG: transposase [Lentisphaeria bacterium]|nr:transposase [Lentisphaeria bacterium]
MRKARLKVHNKDTFYHTMNRLFRRRSDRKDVFDAEDKKYFVNLMTKLTGYFNVEISSYCIMSNHYHIIFKQKCELLSRPAATKRHNDYYKGMNRTKRLEYKGDTDTLPYMLMDIDHSRERMRDMSEFMKALQQAFTTWYNKRHDRFGPLWDGRFKSVILDEKDALWKCSKYVALNPVRAEISKSPADYEFSSWGQWQQKKSLTFSDYFHKAIRTALNKPRWNIAQVMDAFRLDMERTMSYENPTISAWEHSETDWVPQAYKDECDKRKASKPKVLEIHGNCQVDYWTKGYIISSDKKFMDETVQDIFGKEAMNKSYDILLDGEQELLSYQRIQARK